MNRFEPGACCSPILRESARFLVAADGDIEMGGVNARDEIFNFVDRVNANIFRAVRDLAGHAATEFQFGPAGEENAYRFHAAVNSASPIPGLLARDAIAELLGKFRFASSECARNTHASRRTSLIFHQRCGAEGFSPPAAANDCTHWRYTAHAAPMQMSSSAFGQGGAIPAVYSSYEQNASSFRWTGGLEVRNPTRSWPRTSTLLHALAGRTLDRVEYSRCGHRIAGRSRKPGPPGRSQGPAAGAKYSPRRPGIQRSSPAGA